MKRSLSLILSVIIIIACLTGCNISTNKDDAENDIAIPATVQEDSQETIKAVIYDRNTDSDYWEAVIDSFEMNNPGITVDAVISKDAAYELRDMILSGNSPDFVFLPSSEESGVTEALVKDKAMLDLSDIDQVLSSLLITDISSNSVCRPYDDGKLYIAPLFFSVNGMIYNKNILTENGWTVPKTWDEFISLAEKCSEKDIAAFSYAGDEPDEFSDIFAAAVGSEVSTETLNKLFEYDVDTWGSESVKEFAGKLESIKKLVLSGSSTKTKESVLDNFKSGKVLFISATSDTYKELSKDSQVTFSIGFCSYPSLVNDEDVSVVSFSEMYIPVESKNASAAKKFLIYQYSDEALKIAAEKLGETAPVLKIKDLTSENGIDENTLNVYSSISLRAVTPSFSCKNAENESLEDEFCNLCVQIFKGDVSSDDFQQKMTEYIKNY